MSTDAVHKYIDQNKQRFQDELFEFLRIPSVSAKADHKADVLKAAQWVESRAKEIGMKVKLHETKGHPIVVAEWREAGANAPTILIYGHYDVQPEEPVELWESPPFEPTIRDGKIYARGSVDDKGQLYLHLKALESHLKANGKLPVNVIVVAEGEEEVGSENLMPFVEQHKDELKCDAIVISDSAMHSANQPSLDASLRGLSYLEVWVDGPAQDLHSGVYGGGVMNPATALARIIASFHDENGRVQVEGFYDDVDEAKVFRAALAKLPWDDADFTKETGSPELFGEKGFTTLERVLVRPTVEINGLLSGYTGEGAKTVLPARAMAKVSCRLVANQDPHKIAELVKKHIAKHTPKGVSVKAEYLHGGNAWMANVQGPLYEAGAAALEKAFGVKPVFGGSGGSIPIVPEFEKVLKAPAMLMGFGLPGENAHAPNEWMSVRNYEQGVHAAAEVLDQLAARMKK
ncbi:MAG TPA: dipeptidase [Longimicrobiales bacterium]|nr:dipeptidase [Longimicrobiales bacterium]